MKIISPHKPPAIFVFTEVAEFICSLRNEGKVSIEELRSAIRISPKTFYPIKAGENLKISYYGSVCYYLIEVLCEDNLQEKEKYYAELGKRIIKGVEKHFSDDL